MARDASPMYVSLFLIYARKQLYTDPTIFVDRLASQHSLRNMPLRVNDILGYFSIGGGSRVERTMDVAA